MLTLKRLKITRTQLKNINKVIKSYYVQIEIPIEKKQEYKFSTAHVGQSFRDAFYGQDDASSYNRVLRDEIARANRLRDEHLDNQMTRLQNTFAQEAQARQSLNTAQMRNALQEREELRAALAAETERRRRLIRE